MPSRQRGRSASKEPFKISNNEVERDMKLMGCRSINELSRGNLRFR